MKPVTIVDYGRGNLFSLARALDHIGVAHEVSDSPGDVAKADCIVLPGVGAFGDAMTGLTERSLVETIRVAAGRGVPILGICLGMQVLTSRSEEFGDHTGLDLIPGIVRRLPEGDDGAGSVRIPNVGWRLVHPAPGDAFLGDLANDKMFYFVHSYAPVLENASHVIATTPVNGIDATAIIRCENVIGCQFHPEKSGPAGLELLRGFVAFARALREAA